MEISVTMAAAAFEVLVQKEQAAAGALDLWE